MSITTQRRININLQKFSLKRSISLFVQAKFDLWLKKRIPADQQQFLRRDNIFIFPSRLGFAYLFLVFVLFIFGTNYQNNIIVLLSYLMVSIFMTSMLISFFNFSGLRLSMPKNSTAFAKQAIHIPLELSANKERFDLHFSYEQQVHFIDENMAENIATKNGLHLENLNSGNEASVVVDLPYHSNQRGTVNIGRIKVSSEFALGLFTTWTKLDFGHQCIVYPAPKACSKHYYNLMKTEGVDVADQKVTNTELTAKKGIDEFVELKNYRVGESLSRIAWKQLARGQGHFSKHYQEHQNNDCWLLLHEMPAKSIEDKLQLLCWFILRANRDGRLFGVDLGHVKIMPNTGENHKKNCLEHLANYPRIGDRGSADG